MSDPMLAALRALAEAVEEMPDWDMDAPSWDLETGDITVVVRLVDGPGLLAEVVAPDPDVWATDQCLNCGVRTVKVAARKTNGFKWWHEPKPGGRRYSACEPPKKHHEP